MVSTKDELLTINEVVRILKVTRRTLYKWIREGMLDAVRIGRSYRVSRANLNKLLKNGGAE